MKKNKENELRKILDTSYPIAQNAEDVKENVWNKIDLSKKNNFLWFRIAALLLIIFLSTSTIYLYLNRDFQSNQLLNVTEELKTKVNQNQDIIAVYQSENEGLKLSLTENDYLIEKEGSISNTQEIINIIEYDTIRIYQTEEPQFITHIIYDTVIIEKELIKTIASNSHTSSTPTSFQVDLKSNKTRPQEKVRFGIRIRKFNTEHAEEAQFSALRIKL